MAFDSMAAWNRAIDWARTNASVLVPIAGIFVLIPTLVFAWFNTDLQVQLEAAAAASKPGAPNWAILPLFGKLMLVVLIMSFVQMIGTMAMLSLFADKARPTVGEALGNAFRSLPTAIAASLLMMAGLVLFFVPALIVATLVTMLLGLVTGPAVGGMIGAVVVLALLVMVFVRFVLVTPVIVLDRIANPIEALKRSWAMTKGNAGRIAFFLIVLGMGYAVIMLLAQAVAGVALGVGALADAKALAAASIVTKLVVGMLQGVLGCAASIVFTGVTAAMHEQLSGTAAPAVRDTFA
ncbi:MAG: glycerophosphoryl diester phosphodiesterase membrane domain-containing protein [Novosphingobium sp.]